MPAEHPEEVEVDVTQEDIDLGVPKSTAHCAVARAVHRALGKPQPPYNPKEGMTPGSVVVSPDGIFAKFPSVMYLVKGLQDPYEVKRFIRAFDKGERVEPLKFSMRLVTVR